MEQSSRIDQVKFVEDSLLKILLGPFLNTLSQIKLTTLWESFKQAFAEFYYNISKYREYYKAINPFKANVQFIWDVLRDLVPFVQFEKREKHPCRSVTFSKVAGFTLHGCFSRV